ncbi:hypothetical protein V2P57_00305 [Mycoplasma mycoides subsp. mycoides]|uniref:Membrane protein n=2 Tax=Mycoplasma mycoides subsp. mycoides TaxID=2103 RepID=A0AAE2EJ36_MYCMY|nr:membrane protein [Mycoplasma mycoides]CAE76716.1 Hypothetical transmembrane protein [Mycoplasma mycoides subsp. mycoides SC str. PG1]ADK69478.1 conserved hypothetical protein [Mycoplasma mycoides subsp. mycoides SC str. Gladysdale]AIZ54895.1 putative membrane protein [Mycoplasma mycoides subsp. mycoides]AME10272.1 hypothetical protein MmmBen_0065 [Mycoplasma mycoides subsp. mycoides]AME11277.1 hypothetical protein MmmBen50_0064 [Mycoplasma mycoides subsp. mycoides]
MSNIKTIINWISYFKSIKYIILTAILSSLLTVIALTTSMIQIAGTGLFQVADGLFLSLTFFIPGPMMLVVGCVYAMIFDLVSGAAFYVPISIIIHILMFVSIKLLMYKLPFYLNIMISEFFIFLYVLYAYVINYYSNSSDTSQANVKALISLITDFIQYLVSVISAIVLYNVFNTQSFLNLFKKLDIDIYKNK